MADHEHDQEQKTEQPTEKHLTEAMERGQFAKSPELQLVFTLAAALAVFSLTAGSAARELASYAVNTFARLGAGHLTLDTAPVELQGVALETGRVLGPLLLACVLAALLAGGIQSGFQLTPKAFGVHWERLDIVAGLGRLWSKSTIAHFGIDILKLLAVAAAL